jgi:hypothetical protein
VLRHESEALYYACEREEGENGKKREIIGGDGYKTLNTAKINPPGGAQASAPEAFSVNVKP